MIRPYLTDSAVWVRHQGSDQWGEPLPPVEATVKTRIQFRTRVVRDASGKEVVSEAKLLLFERPDPKDTYRFDGRDHPILSVHRVGDFSDRHYEVFVA